MSEEEEMPNYEPIDKESQDLIDRMKAMTIEGVIPFEVLDSLLYDLDQACLWEPNYTKLYAQEGREEEVKKAIRERWDTVKTEELSKNPF